MNIKYSKKKGLTLIEILVSLAILGIIIVPFLSLIVTSTKFTVSSNFKIKATTLAQTVAEYIKNTEYDDLNLNEIYLSEISPSESSVDKELFIKQGEDPKKILLYKVQDEKYKDMLVKIKYAWSSEEIENKSRAAAAYFKKSDFEVYHNNSQIGVSNYESDKTLKVFINLTEELLNKNLEIHCSQEGKVILRQVISNFDGDINLNFPIDEYELSNPITAKITVMNSTDNRTNLNVLKKSGSNVNYTLTTGGNFSINNFSTHNNTILLKKGDEIEVEIYRFTNNQVEVLQQLKVTKIR